MPQGRVVASQNGSREITVNRPLKQYYESVEDHPIKLFMDMGIPVCLGSDNPLLMNTNIGKEHSLAYKAGVRKLTDQLQLTRNAIANANIDPITRTRLAKLIDDYESTVDYGALPKSSALAVTVQPGSSTAPSATLPEPSVRSTVHWPAPSMSKT